MHLHILGICGTFMGSLALLAKQQGHQVSGSDANVYPPMSTQLETAGIQLQEGYTAQHLEPAPDLVIVGNALSRGNPAIEYMLNQGLAYSSGPQWLAQNVLHGRWVLAVSGTHGKTTTATMLTWILQQAGLQPGYLIGGVPRNFSHSANLGQSEFFVIEADEYDTAFFDKRSKFVHYSPKTLIINNLEFDHADIFADIKAIQTQFHHLLRIVPGNGLVLTPAPAQAIDEVVEMGLWSQQQSLSSTDDPRADWSLQKQDAAGSQFSVLRHGNTVGQVKWSLIGEHNLQNALAAVAAAAHVGVTAADACASLSLFEGPKRRLERIYQNNKLSVYDDFAHHPTAIKSTLRGLREAYPQQRIIAIIEPRSNTMSSGVHKHQLAEATATADICFWCQGPQQDWDLSALLQDCKNQQQVFTQTQTLLQQLLKLLQLDTSQDSQVVIMSNGGFENFAQRLVKALSA